MTELLGINYPAPPDTMPRLQKLRHLFAQGLDFERDTVAWLLEQAEARDALADECAELRQQLKTAMEIRADVVAAAEAAEREACARVAEAHGQSDDPVDWQCSSIADAIRARGDTASSQPAEPLPCTCADGPPKFEPPKPLEFDGEYLLRNAAAWFTASTGKCTRCGGSATPSRATASNGGRAK